MKKRLHIIWFRTLNQVTKAIVFPVTSTGLLPIVTEELRYAKGNKIQNLKKFKSCKYAFVKKLAKYLGTKLTKEVLSIDKDKILVLVITSPDESWGYIGFTSVMSPLPPYV